jgi:hypothetical protein
VASPAEELAQLERAVKKRRPRPMKFTITVPDWLAAIDRTTGQDTPADTKPATAREPARCPVCGYVVAPGSRVCRECDLPLGSDAE